LVFGNLALSVVGRIALEKDIISNGRLRQNCPTNKIQVRTIFAVFHIEMGFRFSEISIGTLITFFPVEINFGGNPSKK
jgi:hypothetical protein